MTTKLDDALESAAELLGGTYQKGPTGCWVNFAKDDDYVELTYDLEGELVEIMFENHEFSSKDEA